MIAVVDSSSTDGSDLLAQDLGFVLARIDPRTFNHGRTRQEAVDKFCREKEFVVFLTHDAVIEPGSLLTLLATFSNPRVGAAYGRQLPHHNASFFARHSANFLYPPTSDERTIASASRLGIRAAYLSNSFAAYRLRALTECGGFPSSLILGEDYYVALHMLLAGWSLSYCARALVRHSHDYTVLEELRRYFDIGVLHAQLPELLHELGRPDRDGFRFMKSELRYIGREAPGLLPQALVRSGAKYVGYRLGRVFKKLPNSVRRSLSMTRGYWDDPLTGART